MKLLLYEVEAALLLGVSVDELRRWREHGPVGLSYWAVKGDVLYDPHDVLSCLGAYDETV